MCAVVPERVCDGVTNRNNNTKHISEETVNQLNQQDFPLELPEREEIVCVTCGETPEKEEENFTVRCV